MYYVYTLEGEGYKTNSVRQAVDYLQSIGISRSLHNVKTWIAREGEWFSDVQAAGIARYDAQELQDMPFAPTVDGHYWTEAEIRILLDHYEKQGPAFCYEVLMASGFDRRSRTVVNQKGLLLGLRYQGPRKTQFRKGMTPANKGKKMSPEVYEKTRHTRYVKGNRTGRANQNYVPIGHETARLDGYTWVKVAERKWKEKHRLLWEQAHGPIPPGMLIIFDDGNPHNFHLDNLKMIDRGEHARRNRHGPGPSEYSLLSGRAAASRLNRRGIGDRAIRQHPEMLAVAQAEILLTIQKKKKRHG